MGKTCVMFNQSVIEKIGCYVYCLLDPETSEVFYVGKGTGNRVFEHLACALTQPMETEKLERIRAIQGSGKTVEHLILRHGMSSESALCVEAALIDFIGLSRLTNLQGGHGSMDLGRKTADEITALYSDPILQTDEPVLLIKINQYFNRELTPDELYRYTRMSWRLSVKRNKVKYALATYRGLTREVYQVDEWYPYEQRWAFNGRIADEPIRSALRFKSVAHLSLMGAANPVRYLNCDG